VLNGSVQDDSVFAFISCLDEEDNWQDEATWFKANPNLGITIDSKTFERRRVVRPLASAVAVNFLTKHLGDWAISCMDAVA
jgi:phage terminase large subunit-like protein